jgi:hypothetical protein
MASPPQDVLDRADNVIGRALAIGVELRQLGDRRWRGKCSGCGDADSMELKLNADDRRLWLDCWHATCSEQERLQALDLTIEDLRPRVPKDRGRLVRHRLSDVKLEPVEFLTPGVPRKAVTLMGGDPGLGKSTWTCLLAADVSRAGRAVAMLSAEDTRSVIRGRVDAAGGKLELVEVLTKQDDDSEFEQALTLPDDVSFIEEFIIDTGAALVVIDPLMAFLTDKADANQDHSVRRALANLALMAERRDVGAVVNAHLNKDEQKSVMYRVGGSIGLVGAARSLLLFATDPDDDSKRLLAHGKSNWAELRQTRRYRLASVPVEQDGVRVRTTVLCPDGVSDLSAEQIIGRRRAEGKLQEAKDGVLLALSKEPRLGRDVKTEVADEMDCSQATVKRAAQQLQKTGEITIEQVGRQTYWTSSKAAQGPAHVGLHVEPDPDPGSNGHPYCGEAWGPTVGVTVKDADRDQAQAGEGFEPGRELDLESNGYVELSHEEKLERLERILRGEG